MKLQVDLKDAAEEIILDYPGRSNAVKVVLKVK
jgi:hypothetical protein